MRDLSSGIDVGGNDAVFIHAKHFISEWEVDEEVKTYSKNRNELVYFVVWYPDRNEQGAHGYLEDGEIVQWG